MTLASSTLLHRPVGAFSARTNAKKGMQHRALQAAVRASKQEQQSQQQQPTAAQEVPERDFFEGESWEIVGKIASAAVPLAVAAGVAIGLFAAGTYNEGATVFLDTPKSAEDTAKFYSAVDQSEIQIPSQ